MSEEQEKLLAYEKKVAQLEEALRKANAENEQLRAALVAHMNFAAIVGNAQAMLPRVKFE